MSGHAFRDVTRLNHLGERIARAGVVKAASLDFRAAAIAAASTQLAKMPRESDGEFVRRIVAAYQTAKAAIEAQGRGS
jgi:hypothetical protein